MSSPPVAPSAFAGFRFRPEVIILAVRRYLRFGLSYRVTWNSSCSDLNIAEFSASANKLFHGHAGSCQLLPATGPRTQLQSGAKHGSQLWRGPLGSLSEPVGLEYSMQDPDLGAPCADWSWMIVGCCCCDASMCVKIV